MSEKRELTCNTALFRSPFSRRQAHVDGACSSPSHGTSPHDNVANGMTPSNSRESCACVARLLGSSGRLAENGGDGFLRGLLTGKCRQQEGVGAGCTRRDAARVRAGDDVQASDFGLG